MKDESVTNFGLLIAYVLPGCVVLWGLGQVVPSIGEWLAGASVDEATFGGFLYVTLAAIGSGLTASTIRWLTLDALHHFTGIKPPPWNFSRLGDRVEAFDMLVDIHYRYYQFYANTLAAAVFAYAAWRSSHSAVEAPWGWFDVAAAIMGLIFFAASRDTLRKYYSRAQSLLDG